MASPLSKEAKLSVPSESDSTLTSTSENPTSALNPQSTAYVALNVLKKEDLEAPKLPGSKEMEKMLLDMRKKMLMEEYLGGSK